MALMIPEKRYTYFHESDAEEDVFDAFAEQLPDSYRVFHSEDWFRSPGQQLSDQNRGEIDFLIAHKEKGLLVLEIKGGGIEYDPRKDQWWTINDSGRDRLDKSPAQQANAGMYNLLDRLKRNERLGDNKYFPGVLGWGIFFPDLSKKDAGVFPDMELPEERILFREDMDDLQAEVDKLYDFWEKQHPATGPLNEQQWEALTGTFLRRKFRVMETLGNYIDKTERELVRMTKEQYQVLKVLSNQDEAFINGCAGSGKTLLSLEKARRMAEQGEDVLWLCFNKKLRKHVEEQDGEADFDISHFHSFALQYIKATGVDFEYPGNNDDEGQAKFWEEEIPNLLMEAAELRDEKYDVLIIDEAQDFRDNWFTSLQYVTRDPDERKVYVFYDPNQSIYCELPGWLQERLDDSFPLPRNVRNTENIGRASVNLGEIADDIEYGPPGEPVRMDVAGDDKELVEDMRRAVDELLNKQDLEPEDVVILSRHSRGNSPLEGVSHLGNYRIVNSSSGGRQQILWSTIKAYKGLEADVVLLLIPEWKEEDGEEYYTGASRAKHLLWVFTEDEEVVERIECESV